MITLVKHPIAIKRHNTPVHKKPQLTNTTVDTPEFIKKKTQRQAEQYGKETEEEQQQQQQQSHFVRCPLSILFSDITFIFFFNLCHFFSLVDVISDFFWLFLTNILSFLYITSTKRCWLTFSLKKIFTNKFFGFCFGKLLFFFF